MSEAPQDAGRGGRRGETIGDRRSRGSDGGPTTREAIARSFDPEELRRRNLSALAVDVLYLFTAAFFTTLAMRGTWPAVIAAVPLLTLLYFAWRSTMAFLVAQVLAVALAVVATEMGLLPL